MEFSLELAQSADSPVYRSIIDEQLKEFLMSGLIPFETYLENSSLPFADKILEDVKKAKEGVQEGNPEQTGAAMQQMGQNAPQGQLNPQQMDMVKQGLRQ